MKYYIFLALCIICTKSFGQTQPVNPCIDTVNKKFLYNTWYDLTPNGNEEQRNYVGYYVTIREYESKPKNHLKTITFKPDGTFIQTYQYYDTVKTVKGTWNIPSNTREFRWEVKETGNHPKMYILELNPDKMILKLIYPK